MVMIWWSGYDGHDMMVMIWWWGWWPALLGGTLTDRPRWRAQTSGGLHTNHHHDHDDADDDGDRHHHHHDGDWYGGLQRSAPVTEPCQSASRLITLATILIIISWPSYDHHRSFRNHPDHHITIVEKIFLKPLSSLIIPICPIETLKVLKNPKDPFETLKIFMKLQRSFKNPKEPYMPLKIL